jgi:hypothetical protein
MQKRLRAYAERCGIVGFTGSFEPSNLATLRLHRQLGDAVVTEHGEGRYVAYFDRRAAGEEAEPPAGAGAPSVEKARKSTKKGTKPRRGAT